MVVNLLKLLDNNINILGLIAFCLLSTCILVTEVAEMTDNFHSLLASYLSQTKSNNLITDEQNTEGQNIYIPPNFGGPDSQYGSGRR